MAQGVTRFPGVGCVVEFMQGNAPQIAWVLEEQGGRLRLLLPNRRETAMQASRLLPWSGPALGQIGGKDDIIALLEKHRARRAERVATINSLELWELSQGEVVRGSAHWFAELLEADPDADCVAACGHALLEFKSHFKFNPPDFEILPEDVVTARLVEQEMARKREVFAMESASLLRTLWETYQKGQVVPTPDSVSVEVADKVRGLIRRRLVDPETSEDESLWKQLVKGLPDDPHVPLYLAEAWGLVGAHHNFWLDRSGYEPGDSWGALFANTVETLLEPIRAANMPETPAATLPEPSCSLPFISVDSPTTRDVDDAFHMARLPSGEGWVLTLALACPAWQWPFESDFDKMVSQRGTSLYLPEATHHMLPEALGIDGYSLLAGQWRPALLVRCEVTNEGELISCEPAFSWVRLADNLQYEACERVLEREGREEAADRPLADDDAAVLAASQHVEQLRLGLALAEARMACRLRQGAVIIQRPEALISLQGEGKDVKVTVCEEPPLPMAHLLVAEHMMLANAGLARWAREKGLALLHRTQDVAVPKDYMGVWEAPHDIARVVKALAPACLEITPRPHAGIGEAAYAPSTSPLRRYADLINEAQILHYLTHGAGRYSAEALQALLPGLNAVLERVGQVQRFRPRYWKLLHVRQQGDKVWWPAVITEESETHVAVALPAQQLFVRARRQFFGERTHPGQAIEVRLGKVRPLQNEIAIVETREV